MGIIYKDQSIIKKHEIIVFEEIDKKINRWKNIINKANIELQIKSTI